MNALHLSRSACVRLGEIAKTRLVALLACTIVIVLETSIALSAESGPSEGRITTEFQVKAASIRQSRGDGHHLTRQAWIDLANHYCDNNRHEEAAELWKLIAKSREDSLGSKSSLTADAYFHAGRLLSLAGQDHAAEKFLEHAVSLCPIKPGDGGLLLDYYAVLAHVQLQLHHWPKARQTCRVWLALQHTHIDTEARAHRYLAQALLEMNNCEEARLEMELAMLRYPAWAEKDRIAGIDAQLDYAQILRRCGKVSEAEQLLRALLVGAGRASQSDLPITLRICQELAVCLQQLNRINEACTYSERAMAGLGKWKEMSPWADEIENLNKQLHENSPSSPTKK